MIDHRPANPVARQSVQPFLAPFAPHRLVRSGHIQTLLARRAPAQIRCLAQEQPLLLDAGPSLLPIDEGQTVRLLAYYTPPLSLDEQRGLVVLLHGWEGCSHSNYALILTDALTAAGFAVMRLNFRDHGPDRHVDRYALNRGLFLGILLEEAAAAIRQLSGWAAGLPLSIVGVSMGGNFALRLAGYHRTRPFAQLAQIIAVNPAANPARATDLIDSHPIYRHYFRKRWLASLLAKQALFPQCYAFAPLHAIPTIRGMTDWLIRHYRSALADFTNADDYFAAYRVQTADLAQLTVPVTIIAAMDDPVIDPADLLAFPLHPLLTRYLYPTGGHVGFVNIFPFQHYLPALVLSSLLAGENVDSATKIV
ncbi:MAG: alpha/beta fold hydrolase [Caldilineaceae bacterium]|nr:alpha/beta fold hydrolase [Caldilineaceae bacterium]